MSHKSAYIIRDERPTDVVAITTVTEAAFRNMIFSDHREHIIVDNLRKNGQLIVSLVAESDNKIVGHVAFSPVTIDSMHDDWFGLGPLSVLPSSQKQGIGSALVNQGLESLKQRSGRGCCLIGDPAYYRRFGFRSNPKLSYNDIPTANVMALPFDEEEFPSGKLEFDQSFRTS